VNERQERIGRNEALFRDVNERLEQLNEAFSVVTDRAEFVCECGDAGCAQRIVMTLADYEGIRADSALFVIVPGHEAPDVEDVVDRRGGYDIVRKRPGSPAALAAREHPRT
jgi:hypothetical protein